MEMVRGKENLSEVEERGKTVGKSSDGDETAWEDFCPLKMKQNWPIERQREGQVVEQGRR